MRHQMAIASGLVIPQPLELRAVLAPLGEHLSGCCWLINTQSGPFRDNFPGQNEATYDKLFLETDACQDTAWSC